MSPQATRASRRHHNALRADAKNTRNCCVDDCQDCRKHLCRRRFRDSRHRRIPLAQLHRDSSRGLNERRADSESQFLAIKKFSPFLRWRLIAARQNQFFERIANADSRARPGQVMRHYETHARPRRSDTAVRVRRRASVRCRVCA
jgi:hypothetical protein